LDTLMEERVALHPRPFTTDHLTDPRREPADAANPAFDDLLRHCELERFSVVADREGVTLIGPQNGLART